MTKELHLRSPAGSEAAVYRWPLTVTVSIIREFLNDTDLYIFTMFTDLHLPSCRNTLYYFFPTAGF